MRYNTGNPVEPNGSSDPRDLFDNAGNLDLLVNGGGTSYPDRKGKQRKSWLGIEQDFQNFLLQSGFVYVGPYAAGITLTARNQIFDRAGISYGLAPSVTMPYITTGDWATEQNNFVQRGDAALRQDLGNTSDATKGANIVTWFQAGATLWRTVRDKLRDVVSFRDFGGLDDGATDAASAITAAKSTAGTDGTVRMERKGTGVVRINSAVDLNNINFGNDRNMTVDTLETYTALTGSQLWRFLARTRLYIRDLLYEYILYPSHLEDFAEKRVWLNDGDINRSFVEALPLSGLLNEQVAWPSGDTWTSASPIPESSNPDNPFMFWGSQATGNWYASTQLVRAGDELEACFATGGIYNRLALIRCRNGYYGVYADGVTGQLTMVDKQSGVAVVTTNFGAAAVFGQQPQYFGWNVPWKIRIVGKRQFAIFVGGIQATSLIPTTSDIVRAGFGFMPQTVTSISVSGWTRTRLAVEGGKQNVGITIYGDSMSAPIHGGWDRAMRKALEGSAGLLIDNVANYAVPGYTTTNMWADMQTKGFVGGVTVIAGGTNDIQGLISINTTLANIRSMITYAQANGQTVVAWIPPTWYTRAEAGAGKGQNSSNAVAGASYRVAIKRLCATMQVRCVDMTMFSGPIDARYMLGTYGNGNGFPLAYRVRDNIHPDAFLYQIIGVQIARAILGAICNRVERASDPAALPATYQNGWTSLVANPTEYTRGADGRISLGGYVQAGTLTNGTIVLNLAEDIRPAKPVEAVCCTDNGTCRVTVGVGGNVTINGVPAGAVWINLSPISYPNQN